MSTFNDTIRRQLGFGLIFWNEHEHQPAMILSRPQSGMPPRVAGGTETASPAAALAVRRDVSSVR